MASTCGLLPAVAGRGLGKCLGLLNAHERGAVLAVAWLPAGSDEAAVRAVRLSSLKLLRAEAARFEKDHAEAIGLGKSGVDIAVQGIHCAREARGTGLACLDRLRMATEAAAALADMVAAAGANKLAALRLGGVAALLACIDQHTARCAARELAVRSEDSPGCREADQLAAALCVQACRALGNLCYGWEIDAIKSEVGARGAASVVAAMRTAFTPAMPHAAAVFRWASHAARNLAVRSAPMQEALGEAGGADALCAGLVVFAASARAQEAGCKALAYVLKGHEHNRTVAVAAGALELAVGALRAHALDAGAAEAALTLLCLAVGAAGDTAAPGSFETGAEGAASAAERAVRCGAHLAALGATQALLQQGGPETSTPPRRLPGDADGNADADDGAPLGRPATWAALARSCVWLLAALSRALVSPLRREAALELDAAGLRALFASAAGAHAQRRRKVKAEVDGCLAALSAATGQPLPQPPQSQPSAPPPRPPPSAPSGGAAAAGVPATLRPAPAHYAAAEAARSLRLTPASIGGGPAAAEFARRFAWSPLVTSGAASAATSAAASTAASAAASAAADGFSDSELATCVAVLGALGAQKQLDAPRLRPLRKALGPLHRQFNPAPPARAPQRDSGTEPRTGAG